MKAERSEIFDRLPPNDQEAEHGIIGSILLKPDVLDDLAGIVRPSDFYTPAAHIIFKTAVQLSNEGKSIDCTLVIGRLRDAGKLDQVGGAAIVTRFFDAFPTAHNASHYANSVAEKAQLRSIIHAATDALGDAYEPSAKPAEVMARLEQSLLEIGEHRNASEPITVESILPDVFERIEQRAVGASDGLPTGFADLDEMTGGLHPSELIVLAARPGMGKTALAGNLAESLAVDHGRAVLFISLEMSRFELVERLACGAARLSAHRARTGRLSADERRRLAESSAVFHRRQLLIDDTPSRTIGQIAAIARRQKRKALNLLIVDHILLIEPDNARDPRQEQVAKSARRLKVLARELRIPVLCLAQLNRQVELVNGNRPRLSHLRESGAIEQDADSVIFIHRPEVYAPDDPDLFGKAELHVAKNRHGPPGDVKLTWLPERMRFASHAENHF